MSSAHVGFKFRVFLDMSKRIEILQKSDFDRKEHTTEEHASRVIEVTIVTFY